MQGRTGWMLPAPGLLRAEGAVLRAPQAAPQQFLLAPMGRVRHKIPQQSRGALRLVPVPLQSPEPGSSAHQQPGLAGPGRWSRHPAHPTPCQGTGHLWGNSLQAGTAATSPIQHVTPPAAVLWPFSDSVSGMGGVGNPESWEKNSLRSTKE